MLSVKVRVKPADELVVRRLCDLRMGRRNERHTRPGGRLRSAAIRTLPFDAAQGLAAGRHGHGGKGCGQEPSACAHYKFSAFWGLYMRIIGGGMRKICPVRQGVGAIQARS